eukprot:gene9966-8847_t
MPSKRHMLAPLLSGALASITMGTLPLQFMFMQGPQEGGNMHVPLGGGRGEAIPAVMEDSL